MPRDHHVVVEEMLETIKGIEAAIADRIFKEYESNWVLRRAVERGLEIISEASRHLPAQWTDQHPAIPWSKVRSLGNILRHEYHTVVDRVLWSICEDDLPKMKQAVEAMIAVNKG
jgi:uncharacterized protein with HEPN domain